MAWKVLRQWQMRLGGDWPVFPDLDGKGVRVTVEEEEAMTNALYEGIDKQLASKDAEIAALRKALGLAWLWIDDTELEGALLIAGLHNAPSGPRLANLLAEARHAKDVALALLTPRTL